MKLYGLPTIEFASFIAWQPWGHDYVHRGGVAVIVAQHSVGRLWLDTERVPQNR